MRRLSFLLSTKKRGTNIVQSVKDSWGLRGYPSTWEIFKKAFFNILLPREQREDKAEEFINIRQGGMSVKEYSLQLIGNNKSHLIKSMTQEYFRHDLYTLEI